MQILPFIGQDNVYRGFNFGGSVYESSQRHGGGRLIARSIARRNFVAARPATPAAITTLTLRSPMIITASSISTAGFDIDDIPDGPAYTILIGEFRW